MAEINFPTNLLPTYQSPQQMALSAAQTQNQQANAGLTNEQAQGADIANQGASLRLGLLQNYLQGQGGANGTSPASPPPASGAVPTPFGSTPATGDDITQHAISQFAPIPTARPAAVIAQMNRAAMAGLPGVAANIGAQYDAQVAGENQRRLLGANASYQTADGIANAPAGTAWEALNRSNPEAAAVLKKQDANDTPEKLDADTRIAAQHIAHATYQYSGRDSEFQNGVLVDKKSGAPVTGSEQVLTGLDAAGKQKSFNEANEPMTVGDQLPQPRYKVAGYPTASAYVIAADKAARSSAAAPTSAAPQPTSGAGNSVPASAAPGGAAPSLGDPVLRDALADTSYRYKPPQIPRATTQAELDANKATASEAAKNYQTNTNSLKTSSDEVASASSKALQYFNAAQTILAQPGSAWAAGIPGSVAGMLSKLGIQTDANTTRAEVVKNLTQAALQGLKTTYGSKPAMFDVKVNLEQAFPDIKGDQGLPAVKNLINENIRNLNYDIASGRRVTKYLGAGNDPSQFNTWNEEKFQRSANVNPGGSRSAPQAAPGDVPTATGPNGQKIYLRNGQWAAK